jgi:hypothetical protein
MRKVASSILLGTVFLFATAGALQAQTAVKIASSFDSPITTSIAWPASFTFVQKIVAKQKGSISEIGVTMGSNLTPYPATLTIDIGTTRVFAQSFTGLTQRTTDAATVFPIKGVSQLIQVGDVLTVGITPATDIQMVPVSLDNPDFPRSPLHGSADPVALKFFVNGMAPVTVSAGPPTGGKISGGGLNCGGTATVCSAEAAYGSTVTFTATNTSGEYMFKQWNSGPCSGSANSNCTVVVAANVSLAAWFVRAPM